MTPSSVTPELKSKQFLIRDTGAHIVKKKIANELEKAEKRKVNVTKRPFIINWNYHREEYAELKERLLLEKEKWTEIPFETGK